MTCAAAVVTLVLGERLQAVHQCKCGELGCCQALGAALAATSMVAQHGLQDGIMQVRLVRLHAAALSWLVGRMHVRSGEAECMCSCCLQV